MYFVAIEAEDGEVNDLVGPFPNDGEASVWLRDFVVRHDFDEDFIAVLTTISPEDPEVHERYG